MFDEQLRFYARRNAYVYIPAESSAAVIYSHTQANDLCKDLLTIHAIKDTQSSEYYKVLHCGSYCALVHLSCELLCEIISQSPYNQWNLLLKNIVNLDENVLTVHNTFQQTQQEALEIFFHLNTKAISKQRSACLMLPYRVLTTIVHKINKNKRGTHA